MDGIRGGDPPLVVRLATRGWDLRSLRSVEIGEVTNDRVALRGLVRRYVFEKSTANDLKALIGTRGAPRGLHSSHDVLKTLKRRLTALTANLDVRGRDGHDQKHPRHCASGLGERLSEGELSIERPGGESIYAVELPRVGDPFVDEDQARRLRLKQLDQPGPRARARSRFSGAVFPPRFSVQRRRPGPTASAPAGRRSCRHRWDRRTGQDSRARPRPRRLEVPNGDLRKHRSSVRWRVGSARTGRCRFVDGPLCPSARGTSSERRLH